MPQSSHGSVGLSTGCSCLIGLFTCRVMSPVVSDSCLSSRNNTSWRVLLTPWSDVSSALSGCTLPVERTSAAHPRCRATEQHSASPHVRSSTACCKPPTWRTVAPAIENLECGSRIVTSTALGSALWAAGASTNPETMDGMVLGFSCRPLPLLSQQHGRGPWTQWPFLAVVLDW